MAPAEFMAHGSTASHDAVAAMVSNGSKVPSCQEVCPGSLSDESREEAICRAGLAMQRAYSDFLTRNKQADLDRAYQHMQQMVSLVKGRRAEFVAQLEQQRGLTK